MKNFIIFTSAICGLVGTTFGSFVRPVFADEITNLTPPQIYIKAINPGYAENGKSNVGELIEIARYGNLDTPISLAGVSLDYTNSSREPKTIVEFPENSYMSGETTLLRLASSPESELANTTYKTTLAKDQGPLELKWNGVVLDSVCWTGKDGCLEAFEPKTGSPKTYLVQESFGSGFSHVLISDYEPKYDPDSYYLADTSGSGSETVPDSGGASAHCQGLTFSEILSYYAETKDEQFIEVQNSASEQILMDGCSIRYKNKSYEMTGILKPEEYAVFSPFKMGFSLTKNPTNSNTIEILDADGSVVDKLEYLNGQKKATSWAFVGYDANGEEIWRTTYAPTPGEANNYQEFRTCEEGKVINAATGNCVKVTATTAKVCAAGQYLNLLTNRCKKIETTASATTCKEGYYLYEETGRCRKVTENTGANYSLSFEEYEEGKTFVAGYAVMAVLFLAGGYLIYEFRYEILGVFRPSARAARFGQSAQSAQSREHFVQIRKVFAKVRRKLRRGADRH